MLGLFTVRKSEKFVFPVQLTELQILPLKTGIRLIK